MSIVEGLTRLSQHVFVHMNYMTYDDLLFIFYCPTFD